MGGDSLVPQERAEMTRALAYISLGDELMVELEGVAMTLERDGGGCTVRVYKERKGRLERQLLSRQ